MKKLIFVLLIAIQAQAQDLIHVRFNQPAFDGYYHNWNGLFEVTDNGRTELISLGEFFGTQKKQKITYSYDQVIESFISKGYRIISMNDNINGKVAVWMIKEE